MEDRTQRWGASGVPGSKNGRGSEARFDHPSGIAVDENGDIIVIEISFYSRIRKISGRDGTVSKFAAIQTSAFSTSNGIVCGRAGELYFSDFQAVKRVRKDGSVTILKDFGNLFRGTFNVGLAIDNKKETLFATNQNNNSVIMISIDTGAATVISESHPFSQVSSVDGIGTEEMLKFPHGIAVHHRTGDLFVVDKLKNHVRKLSQINEDSGENRGAWTMTSICISLMDKISTFFEAVAIFRDVLFLVCTNDGSVIQSSLDGRATKVIEKLECGRSIALTADARYLYATQQTLHTVTRIRWMHFWSPQAHCNLDTERKLFVRVLVVASRCVTANSKCNLQKLPREILLHILSFLDIGTL
jgi:DNA-binding beta-propeller fold protein YncE